MTEPTIFEISSPGRAGVKFQASDVPELDVPKEFLREELHMNEVS